MSKKLAGKVAVVTGASKGIGASIAKHMAQEGAAVVVNYSSSKEGADRVVDEIVKGGGKAVAVQANVSKKADVERLFSETKKAFGKLDVLVNNAGIYEFAPLEEVTAEHFHKHFDLNVLGLLFASQEAVKLFGPAGGSIVNVSSVASSQGFPTASVYSATKAAVDAVTRTLAKELGPRKIRVNSINPRWAVSVSRRILLPSPCFWLRPIRHGLPANHCTSRAACGRDAWFPGSAWEPTTARLCLASHVEAASG
jgi:3-oxoacyl-[acyl-carrier protein] reductase